MCPMCWGGGAICLALSYFARHAWIPVAVLLAVLLGRQLRRRGRCCRVLPLLLLVSTLCVPAMGSIRARRLVHIGEDYYLLKLTYRGNVAQSLTAEDLAHPETAAKLDKIGEAELSLDDINARTDEELFDDLIYQKGWHFHGLEHFGHIPADLDPETWDSIAFTFLRSTFFLTLEKLKVEEPAFDPSLRPANPVERIKGHLAELFRMDRVRQGEIVAIIAAESLGPEHSRFYLENRFGFETPRVTPMKLEKVNPFKPCWVPGFENAETWYGDSIFLHSMLIRKDKVGQSLVREIFSILHQHGLLTTAQVIAKGETLTVGEATITGPAYTVPHLIYSLAHDDGRVEGHRLFGFQPAKFAKFTKPMPSGENLLEVELPNLKIRPRLPLLPAPQRVSYLPIFIDKVVRKNAMFVGPHPNLRYPQAKRTKEELLADPCAQAVIEEYLRHNTAN